MTDPLTKPKDDYRPIIEKIGSEQSAVGIDAQFTHAVIIDYLRQISDRLEAIERSLRKAA